MNKRKLIETINSHRGFFRFSTKIRNALSLKNKLRAKGCKTSIGVSVIKGLKIISYGGDNYVEIGDFVRIRNSTIILRGSHNRIIIKDFSHLTDVELYAQEENNEITIGSHTGFLGKAHLAAIEGTKLIIGDHCLMSGNLHFRTGDSHSILNMEGQRINRSEDIVIDDHVWIGTGVTCLKGVHVSKDSVVAATATLCKKYDTPNVILGGVPARIIKTDITWSDERI